MRLTATQKQVLSYYVRGHHAAEIGRLLFKSPRTVEWHLFQVHKKLGTHSVPQAMRVALEENLIDHLRGL